MRFYNVGQMGYGITFWTHELYKSILASLN